jgi:hypothetical protein
MERHVACHEIAFSDDQEQSGDQDDVPTHCSRGPLACTTDASDKAKARMETKGAVEMAYMVK